MRMFSEILESQKGRLDNPPEDMFQTLFTTVETPANREDDDEDQGNDDCKNNEFYLHVLKPHLSSHLSSLCSEILRLSHSF